MQIDIDILLEIPCFKCLFWDPKRESHLHCDPKECQALTEWLLKQVEKHHQAEESAILVEGTKVVSH